jgi:hypothetical protein
MPLKQKIANYFATCGSHIAAVYLYGSHAGGKSRIGSGVDIAILFSFNDPAVISESIEDALINLPRLLREDVHPVAMNQAGEELLKQIFGKGECILVQDQKKLTHFKMTACSKISDFSYYRNRMQSGLIRNILEN